MSDTQRISLTLEQEEDYAFRIRFDETTIADLMTDESAPLGKGAGWIAGRFLLGCVAGHAGHLRLHHGDFR